MNWAGMAGGFWFAGLGVANLLGYGLSLFMTKENYELYFAYNGDGRFFQPFKAMIGSNKLTNVMWTSPLLIGGGLFLQKSIGSMRTTKFFGLALMSHYLFMCAGGPSTFFWNLIVL